MPKLHMISHCGKDWLVGIDGKDITGSATSGGYVKGTPYMAIGNDEIAKAPPIQDMMPCKVCGKPVRVIVIGRDTVRPFSCGSEYGDWKLNNCERCAKFTTPPSCDLESALAQAYFGNGKISQEIADRLGVKTDTYKWFCKERVRQ